MVFFPMGIPQPLLKIMVFCFLQRQQSYSKKSSRVLPHRVTPNKDLDLNVLHGLVDNENLLWTNSPIWKSCCCCASPWRQWILPVTPLWSQWSCQNVINNFFSEQDPSWTLVILVLHCYEVNCLVWTSLQSLHPIMDSSTLPQDHIIIVLTLAYQSVKSLTLGRSELVKHQESESCDLLVQLWLVRDNSFFLNETNHRSWWIFQFILIW